MSLIDENKLDDLFESLKQLEQTNSRKSTSTSDDISFPDSEDEEDSQLKANDDKIEFTDNAQDATREQQFEEIERNLKKLPKLENSFDKLSTLQKTKESQSSKLLNVKINDPVDILNNRMKVKPADGLASKSDKWFHIGKPELTPQLKRDLLVIKHRQALDPKRHYKKDKWVLPKNFQVGTIVENKAEFFSSRINKKDRTSTILGSLINETHTNKYFKRKYTEIQDAKTRHGRSRHSYKSKR